MASIPPNNGAPPLQPNPNPNHNDGNGNDVDPPDPFAIDGGVGVLLEQPIAAVADAEAVWAAHDETAVETDAAAAGQLVLVFGNPDGEAQPLSDAAAAPRVEVEAPAADYYDELGAVLQAEADIAGPIPVVADTANAIDAGNILGAVQNPIAVAEQPPPAAPADDVVDTSIAQQQPAVATNAAAVGQNEMDENETFETTAEFQQAVVATEIENGTSAKTEEELQDVENNGTTIQQEAAKTISAVGKKDRKEFTAAEKLHLLSLLDSPHDYDQPAQQQQPQEDGTDPTQQHQQQQQMTVKQLRQKYGVSKSSLHRWKQNRQRLLQLVSQEGLGGRKRDTKDILVKIKVELKQFVDDNNSRGMEERLAITTPVIESKAREIMKRLVEGHEGLERSFLERQKRAEEGIEEQAVDAQQQMEEVAEFFLSSEEYDAIKSFKVTKSWAGRVASSMGLLSNPRAKKRKRKEAKSEDAVEPESVTAAAAPAAGEGVAEITAPTTSATAATKTDATPETKMTTADLSLCPLETVDFLEEHQAKQNTANYLTTYPLQHKQKKARREFSALEKLQILLEMDPPHSLKMEQICAKYHTSKSSVFRWRIQKSNGQLNKMVENTKGHKKRTQTDKLVKIKEILKQFIGSNNAAGGGGYVLNGTVLQQEAQLARDTLLLQHTTDPSKGILTGEEEVAMRNFKASKGWARKVAAHYGLRGFSTTVTMNQRRGIEFANVSIGVGYGIEGAQMQHANAAVGEGNNEMPPLEGEMMHDVPPPPGSVAVDQTIAEASNHHVMIDQQNVVEEGIYHTHINHPPDDDVFVAIDQAVAGEETSANQTMIEQQHGVGANQAVVNDINQRQQEQQMTTSDVIAMAQAVQGQGEALLKGGEQEQQELFTATVNNNDMVDSMLSKYPNGSQKILLD